MGWLLLFAIVVLALKSAVSVGEEHQVDIKDPHIVELVKFATKTTRPKKELKELISVTRKVVAGSLVTLTFKTSGNSTCFVEILEQIWRNRTEIIESTCHDISSNTRQSFKSGDEEREYLMMKLFRDFIKKHRKTYETATEYEKRFSIFKSNLKTIKLHSKLEMGTATYGVNKFADLALKEFKKRLGLVKPDIVPKFPEAVIPLIDSPESYDWRHYNAVTPVKDQGYCGSCWAFSVTGNVEGQWALKRRELLQLSEQELVDCDEANLGCNGGWMSIAYDSIVRLGGLESLKDYPYRGKADKCNLNLHSVEVKIQGGVNITNSEEGMAKWLVANGPISVAMNAGLLSFYMGGILHPFKSRCNPNNINHAVLIVGYGVDFSRRLNRTLPYWIVKNSWGTDWGEQGYFRMFRGDGTCGINTYATSAIL